MLGGIPEQIINDIQDRSDIVEVISGYIPLKRSGRNFRANCPFHHEKTPSFMVSPDKQIYHCFGCGVGGNVFNFLMRYEKLQFPEAVEMLAKKAGVEIPKKQQVSPEQESLNQKLYKINELAGDFYHQYVLTSPEAKPARDYLSNRNITIETIKKFQLGFAPNKWDALISYLRSKNIILGLIDKAGLCVAKEDKNGYYDRFRNRIIFPIFDVKSRIVAFGARVLTDALPKYINSPETPIYSKGRNIFGLNFAKDEIRKKNFSIIVEGYLDFITPFQAGVGNIVASLGTALTEEQIRLLKRYSHNAMTIFDPDQAGQLATLRSLDLFIEEEMNVKVVVLPSGVDPDSYIRKNSVNEFNNMVLQAKNIYDYKLNVLIDKYDRTSVEGKADIAGEMLPTINRFKNAILKFSYLRKLAEFLMLNEESLFIELNKLKKVNASLDRAFLSQPQAPVTVRLRPAEKTVLRLILEDTSFLIQAKDLLDVQDFQDIRIRDIVNSLFGMATRGEEIRPNRIMNLTKDQMTHELIAGIVIPDEERAQDREKTFFDCVKRMKQDRVKNYCQQLRSQIKAAENQGDRNRVDELMQEYNMLIKKGA